MESNEFEETNVLTTTDLPDPEGHRKDIQRKRFFFIFVIISLILVGFLVWEILELVFGVAK